MAVTSGDAEKRRKKKYLMIQAVLCALCTAIGALYPTLLDIAKTAIEQETVLATAGGGGAQPQTQARRVYPFSSVSVVLANNAVQLSLAVFAVSCKEGFSALRSCGLRTWLAMLPLGAVYAAGELLTLRSVEKGSGPVYVVIANMKLVIAALVSRAYFGRVWSHAWLHWLELVFISLAAAAYTLVEAGSMGAQWHWEGAWTALTKSTLVSFTSVLCEDVYKRNRFHVVLALQSFWSLMSITLFVSLALAGLGPEAIASELRDDAGGALSFFGGGPARPLCGSEAHAVCLQGLAAAAASSSCRCISRRGWDVYTLGAVVADLSNAVSSALVFKRLSAVAKYVCRAMSAVPMYLTYCALGRASLDSRLPIVIFLCWQVSCYIVQRQRVAMDAVSGASNEGASWSGQYVGSGGDKKQP